MDGNVPNSILDGEGTSVEGPGEVIEFEISPEDEAVTVDQLEAEIQANLALQQKILAEEFPSLAGLSPELLPDGAGDELRAALRRYQDYQIHGKQPPTMEQDAALAAASFAMKCGVTGDYDELWAVVTGQKSFFE